MPELEELIRKHIFDNNGLKTEATVSKDSDHSYKKPSNRHSAPIEKTKPASSSKKQVSKEPKEEREKTPKKDLLGKSTLSSEDVFSPRSNGEIISDRASLRVSKDNLSLKTPDKKVVTPKSAGSVKPLFASKSKDKSADQKPKNNLSLCDLDNFTPKAFDLAAIEHYIE